MGGGVRRGGAAPLRKTKVALGNLRLAVSLTFVPLLAGSRVLHRPLRCYYDLAGDPLLWRE